MAKHQYKSTKPHLNVGTIQGFEDPKTTRFGYVTQMFPIQEPVTYTIEFKKNAEAPLSTTGLMNNR